MSVARRFLRDTQTEPGAGGIVHDLSADQGTPATLGSGNTQSTAFVVARSFTQTVGDTVVGSSFPTSANMASVSASTLEWRWRIQRVSSSGAVQASSAYSPVHNTAGIKAATLTLSTTWAAGDRLVLVVEFRRVSGNGNRSFTLNVNDADSFADPDFAVPGSGAFRLRGVLRFTAGSGMAQWCMDQNTVRLGMAYHLNEGTVEEELSRHSVTDDVYHCDLIFPERALAVDTWATILDPSVLAWLRPDDELERSHADMHQCEHETVPRTLCPAPEWMWP